MITEFCLSSNTVCVDRSINFLDQSLQYSTRSAFGKVIGTIGNHILHCLGPAYGSGELSYQVCLDFSGILCEAKRPRSDIPGISEYEFQ